MLALAAQLAGCAVQPALQPRPELYSYAGELRRAANVNSPAGRPSQLPAAVHAMLGDVDGAIAAFDATQPMRMPLPAPDLSRDQPEDAIAAILREASTRQIVILNEAHHVPMHRAFAMRLARGLRKLGFEYLACEAFSRGTDPNAGVVDRASGAYLQDPVFAEFIREARRDGWKLLAYEAELDPAVEGVERMRRREQGQARNLVEQLLARQPGAKLFIHVGYGHGLKEPAPLASGGTMLWMAGELKQRVGIDPLSVDQSWLHAHPEPSREIAGYRSALARQQGAEPFVLRKHDGSARLLNLQPGMVDLQVIHPPHALTHGRPAWLAAWAQRRPFRVPDAWLPASGRRLIYAVHKEHPAHAVPADIVIVEAGKPAPALMLPAGEFRFEFEPF
jgi:sugar phosphate isomerase/epimerase